MYISITVVFSMNLIQHKLQSWCTVGQVTKMIAQGKKKNDPSKKNMTQ